MTRRYLFVGDLHGYLTDAKRAVEFAVESRCNEIIQVGDWGFSFGDFDRTRDLSQLLVDHQISMRFIDGNHDHFSRLHSLRPGEHNVAPNLTYQQRGSLIEDGDGTRFLFLGGAFSVDRMMRTEGVDWWPEEEITDAELDRALAWTCRVDVLVTHDAPWLPVRHGVNEPQSRRSQDIIASVITAHQPRLVVHGHYHCRYTRTIGSIKVEGLAHGKRAIEAFCLPFEFDGMNKP